MKQTLQRLEGTFQDMSQQLENKNILFESALSALIKVFSDVQWHVWPLEGDISEYLVQSKYLDENKSWCQLKNASTSEKYFICSLILFFSIMMKVNLLNKCSPEV